MTSYVMLALLNGVVIGTSRTVYGQLSSHVGPFNASVWAHIVGFVFLLLLILTMRYPVDYPFAAAPPIAYLGGFFGALFVVVSSYVFPRLGAMKAALLVISGQMVTAVLLDWVTSLHHPTALTCLGVVVVVFAMYLSSHVRQRRLEAVKP